MWTRQELQNADFFQTQNVEFKKTAPSNIKQGFYHGLIHDCKLVLTIQNYLCIGSGDKVQLSDEIFTSRKKFRISG